MATKAELETELANLKLELEESRTARDTKAPEADASEDTAKPEHDAQSLRQVLSDHGVDTDTVEALSTTLLDELKALQKEKPLTVAIAAFALGLVVGRASK